MDGCRETNNNLKSDIPRKKNETPKDLVGLIRNRIFGQFLFQLLGIRL